VSTAAAKKVPVIAYHSVRDECDPGREQLALGLRDFERQLRYLKRSSFQTIDLYALYDHLNDGTPLPARSLVLTFDDGYLDNWVNVWPLLRRYGMKATIFVASDFVDPSAAPRPTLEDVWSGRLGPDALPWRGYLNAAELVAMQESGVMDIQSHTRSHTDLPISGEIIDFHHPGDHYPWLSWNRVPANKPHWLTRDCREDVPWGAPVYAFGQALLQPSYLEDPRLSSALTEHVARSGAERFFDGSRWRDELHAIAARHRSEHGDAGRVESQAEYERRVVADLRDGRRILAERLGKPVDFLGWPGGDYTERIHELAIEVCGYRATVNTEKICNQFGDDPTKIRRIYFGQDYRGPARSALVFMNFAGNVAYQSGARRYYPLSFTSRRLMSLGRRLGARD
jgi:hypothetical protein